MKRKDKTKLIMLVLILPILLINIISAYAVTELLGSEVSYDRSASKLRATNVDDAIDELYEKIKERPAECPDEYDCSNSKLPVITYNANGGEFDNSSTTNKVIYNRKILKTKTSDDEGNFEGTLAKTYNTDTVTIEGADNLEIFITYKFSSNSSSYSSWAAIYDSTVEPTTSNYSSSVSGKLDDSTLTTTYYVINGNTVKIYLYNDYYNGFSNVGYFAVISSEKVGTYKEPTNDGYGFKGWNTKADGSGTLYKTKEELMNVIKENKQITLYAQWGDYVCKRASALHSDYGQLGTSGTLATGDAFDCDINGDGTYNATNERFYYVSDYYDTKNRKFNSDIGVLIFYKDYSSNKYYAEPDSMAAYSHYGPSYAVNYLPTTSSWNNVSLYKSTRAILNEQGEYTSKNGSKVLNTERNFSYEGRAARFLTLQEILEGCNLSTSTSNISIPNSCKFLIESTSSSSYGYWLETIQSTSHTYARYVGYSSVISSYYAGLSKNSSSNYDVRPTIDVLKTDIDY